MLFSNIREGQHNVIVKIILGLVILSFAMTGVYSYLRPNTVSNTIVYVNGEEISRNAFENAYRQETDRLRSQMGESFEVLMSDAEYVEKLRSEVLEKLVDEKLLLQEAKNLGLEVSDQKIESLILSSTIFQKEGVFDKDLYHSFLFQSGYTAKGLSEYFKNELLKQQLVFALRSSSFILDEEVEDMISLETQQRDVEYVTFNIKDYIDNVQVTDEELMLRYEADKPLFKTEKQFAVEYISLSIDALMKNIDIANSEIQAYYQENIRKYQNAERRLVYYMSLQDDDTLNQALTRLQEGEAFSVVARDLSDDDFSSDNDGRLGWYTKDELAVDEIEEIFNLNKGTYTEVITSSVGKQIFYVEDIEPATTTPLDKVKNEIITYLKKEKALMNYYDYQQQLVDLTYEIPDSLVATASKLNIPLINTGLVNESELDAILLNSQVKTALLSDSVLFEGNNSDVLEINDKELIVLRVNEYKPSVIDTFDNVKEQLEQIIKQEKALILVENKSEETMKSWLAGVSPKNVLQVNDLNRLEKKRLNENLVKFIFTMNLKSNIANFTLLDDNEVAVVKLLDIHSQKLEPSDYRYFEEALLSLSSFLYIDSFITALKDKATIKYQNM